MHPAKCVPSWNSRYDIGLFSNSRYDIGLFCTHVLGLFPPCIPGIFPSKEPDTLGSFTPNQACVSCEDSRRCHSTCVGVCSLYSRALSSKEPHCRKLRIMWTPTHHMDSHASAHHMDSHASYGLPRIIWTPTHRMDSHASAHHMDSHASYGLPRIICNKFLSSHI